MSRYNLPYTSLSSISSSNLSTPQLPPLSSPSTPIPIYETYDTASHEQPFISSPSTSEAVRTLPYMTPRYANTAPVDTEESLLLKRIHDSFVHSAIQDDQFDQFLTTIKQAVRDRVLFPDTYDHLKYVYDQYIEAKNKILQLRSQIVSITPEQYGATLGALMYDYNRKVINLNETLMDLDSQNSIDALRSRCQKGDYCSLDNGPCSIKDGRCDYRYDQAGFDGYFKKS